MSGVAVLLAGAAPARAALTPSPEPLSGSSFQGADGNQASEGGLTDWDALQTSGRIVHSDDPNALDTTFAGGTEEGDPAHWEFDRTPGGVTPAKANILDAWSAVDQPAGTTFLYLAFARNASVGDTFLAFELNQSGRTWVNDNNVRVPCRRDGDILVSYEISGNSADVFLRRWNTVVTDPVAGCDRTGTIQPFARVKADVQAQGAINPITIENHLPGISGEQILPRQFGEAALNLNALLGPAFEDGCYAFGSIWMHSRSSHSFTSQMQDYIAPTPIDLRTCAAEGTKFFDLDADGVRDANEPGIPGFQIFADYDDDGQLDPGEPSTVTDSSGRYVLNDIRHGPYRLRERLVPTRRRATNDWRCSFPNAGTDGGFGSGVDLACGWGPIDPHQEPNATGRDFGNWYPAQLTVTKQLVPPADPGRFDLFVDGGRVFENARDGSSVTRDVPPGFYTVSEQAVPPADPSQYISSVSCKTFTQSRRLRAGTVFANVSLPAGSRATCTFVNVRAGTVYPAIAIDKSGPAVARAGDTLHYTLKVTNPGTVPFAEDQVHVSDPTCNGAPDLSDKSDGSGPDGSPGQLDPGDVWTYKCSRKTGDSGEDCELSVVHNTATATGEAGGVTVKDTDTIPTTLTCPDKLPPDPPKPIDPPVAPNPPDPPVPPQPPAPDPLEPVVPGQPVRPGVVIPPGPRPPRAGAAGVTGLAESQIGRCLAGLPHLVLRGRHISRVRVSVDGRVVRRLRGRPLERRLTIVLPRHLAPGPHRMVAHVQFRLGSGTSQLTLIRRVRICRALAPRFTG